MRCTLFLFLIFTSSLIYAQDLPGKRDSINSDLLKEKRTFQVILPENYKPGSTDKYDVLYVLDGDWNTTIASQVVGFLADEKAIPPTIVVGIFNTDRDRDLLPTHNKSNKTSGGGDKFLNFMKDELIPYINRTYPSNGNNTLFGHSFGGVLVTYALLTQPQLFRSYIAADPSLWWDNNVMIKMTADKLSSLAGSNRTWYISGRKGQGMIDMRIPQIDSLLKKSAPAGLPWTMVSYADETHGTVRLKSLYDGLKFSYAGYTTATVVFHPMSGILLKDKPINLWYFNDTTKVRYTVDGTEPVLTSPAIQHENQLTSPGNVTIKRFTNSGRYDQTFTGNFKSGDYLPPHKLSNGMRPGGFNYAYYEGEWNKLPDFKQLKPVKTGKIDSGFSTDKLPKKDHFALVISGQLEVKEDGYYLFGVDQNDGSKFYIDGQPLIVFDSANDGNGQGKSFMVPLKKGFYPIREEYFQKSSDHKLDVEYLTPSVMNTKHSILIPLNLQYGKAD